MNKQIPNMLEVIFINVTLARDELFESKLNTFAQFWDLSLLRRGNQCLKIKERYLKVCLSFKIFHTTQVKNRVLHPPSLPREGKKSLEQDNHRWLVVIDT